MQDKYILKQSSGFEHKRYRQEHEDDIPNLDTYLRVSEETYANLFNHKLMWQDGILVENPNYEDYKKDQEAKLNILREKQIKNKQVWQLKEELYSIQKWFTDNDWKPNKIITGEWQVDDPRWIEYLNERTVKRARQDELNELLQKNS